MRVDRLKRGANDVLAELGDVEHGLALVYPDRVVVALELLAAARDEQANLELHLDVFDLHGQLDLLVRGLGRAGQRFSQRYHCSRPRVNSRGQSCAQAGLTVNLLLVSACSRAALGNPRAREKFCESLPRRHNVHWGPRRAHGSHAGALGHRHPCRRPCGRPRNFTRRHIMDSWPAYVKPTAVEKSLRPGSLQVSAKSTAVDKLES